MFQRSLYQSCLITGTAKAGFEAQKRWKIQAMHENPASILICKQKHEISNVICIDASQNLLERSSLVNEHDMEQLNRLILRN